MPRRQSAPCGDAARQGGPVQAGGLGLVEQPRLAHLEADVADLPVTRWSDARALPRGRWRKRRAMKVNAERRWGLFTFSLYRASSVGAAFPKEKPHSSNHGCMQFK